MPYITKIHRVMVDAAEMVWSAGGVNYLITREIDRRLTLYGVSYDHLNAIIGDLDLLQIRFAVGNTQVGVPNSELLDWMTNLILDWFRHDQYVTVRDAVGVLSCVRQELYRRVASPYEDSKIMANGDVYHLRCFF